MRLGRSECGNAISVNLYPNSFRRVETYGQLLPERTTPSEMRQGYTISPFFSSFVMDAMLEHALQINDCSGVEQKQL